jgi:pimeloyl-ACP methyl ester carboxylesterase/catechol 2,3-dioxygenase-like lactoylglutathione lyase family enzyme
VIVGRPRVATRDARPVPIDVPRPRPRGAFSFAQEKTMTHRTRVPTPGGRPRPRVLAWVGTRLAGICAFAALAVVMALPVRPAVAADPPVVRRTTLIVHDVEASIRFYRDVLGYSVWLRNDGRVSAESLPSDAPPGAPSRFAIMKGRHPWLGMVGLLQYGDARPVPAPPAKLVPGDAVLMMEVEDLDAIHARMKAAGTPVLRPPRTTEVTGAGGARWTASFLFAWDPDGHLLEINQRRPAPAGGPASAPRGAQAIETRRAFVDPRWGQLHVRRAAPVAAVGSHLPVVLLHMTPLSGRMFEPLQARLATDRVVLAPDTPGYGDSDGPPTRPEFGDYADVLGDWLGQLDEPVDLVGYHTGAALAVEIARRYPQRVRRVVLIAVPLLTDEAKARLRTAESPVAREDGAHLTELWNGTMRVRPPGQTLEQVARTVADKQASAHPEWAIRALVDVPLDARLAGLERPTLVVRPKDSLWDATAAAALLVPGARLVDRPEWAYGLFDAAPDAVAATLREFLDAPDAAPR